MIGKALQSWESPTEEGSGNNYRQVIHEKGKPTLMDGAIDQKSYIVPGGAGHEGANNARGFTTESKCGKLGTFVAEGRTRGGRGDGKRQSVVVHNRESRA
jgi:hypothetical protein